MNYSELVLGLSPESKKKCLASTLQRAVRALSRASGEVGTSAFSLAMLVFLVTEARAKALSQDDAPGGETLETSDLDAVREVFGDSASDQVAGVDYTEIADAVAQISDWYAQEVLAEDAAGAEPVGSDAEMELLDQYLQDAVQYAQLSLEEASVLEAEAAVSEGAATGAGPLVAAAAPSFSAVAGGAAVVSGAALIGSNSTSSGSTSSSANTAPTFTIWARRTWRWRPRSKAAAWLETTVSRAIQLGGARLGLGAEGGCWETLISAKACHPESAECDSLHLVLLPFWPWQMASNTLA